MNVPERALQPTRAQLETLLEFLEKNPIIVEGLSSKHVHKKDEARIAWQKLAVRLNSMGGCTKTSKQWTKYWTDKKSAVKKKAIQRAQERNKTGEGGEATDLSVVEERILTLMGGKLNIISTDNTDQECDPGTSSMSRVFIRIMDESPPTVKQSPPSSPQDILEPTSFKRSRTSSSEGSLRSQSVAPHLSSETSKGYKRRLKTLTSRKQSMLSLTERCLRIEEQRVETDRRNSKLMETALNLLREREASNSQLFAGLTSAVLAVGESLKLLAEAINK